MHGSRKKSQISGRVSPDQARAWTRAWNGAGIRLESPRRRRLEKLTSRDVQQAMLRLEGALRALLRNSESRRTSGLVELQTWLRRLRK